MKKLKQAKKPMPF